MNIDFLISQMSADEVSLMVDWAAQEGWNPGLSDATCFYQAFPHDFFSGKLNLDIIATASAVIYDAHFAFFGCYIVDKAYRGQGYGLQLTKAVMDYMGDRIIGLDGVVNMVEKYERLGFKYAHANTRYCLNHTNTSHMNDAHMTPLEMLPFDELVAYDNRHFPAKRPQFLKTWISQTGHNALAYVVDNQISGYGVIRPCREGFKIGPLFANTPVIADAIFNALCPFAQGASVYLDIPEPNTHAQELVMRYQMIPVFSTARMYTKHSPSLPINQIYGITTFELG